MSPHVRWRGPLGLVAMIVLLLSATARPVAAQPSPPVDTFDLVLYGSNLDGREHAVALRTNPWESDAWTVVGRQGLSPCGDESRIRVVPGLSAARFLGQDIRENYVALKIVSEPGAAGRLRAAYAFPSAQNLDPGACTRLADLIASSPMVAEKYSLASHTRPQPASLRANSAFVEHLEAPIRHRRPGVMEVEWLEILFRPEE